MLTDCWPGLLEWARMRRESRSGTVGIEFRDGAAQEIVYDGRIAIGEKLAKMLPAGSQPICPICKRVLVKSVAMHGNVWRCERLADGGEGCDLAWTIWELYRRRSLREAAP